MEYDFPTYKQQTIREQKEKVYTLKFFEEFITEPNHVLFGAFDDDTLIGIAAVKTDIGGVAFLEWIAVDRNYRGKGLGCQLIDAVERWAVSKNCHYLHFLTESEYNRTHFYPNRGFELVGVHKNSWYGEDEYIFAKHLKPAVSEKVFTFRK